jgi:serine/threonine-protein kinase RsbW
MHSRRMVHIAGSRAGIRRANDLFGKFSAAHHLPAGAVWPFQIALDEMLSNIVDHGGPAKPKARTKAGIDIEFRLDQGILELTIEDDAAAFDPLTAPVPDTKAPLESRPVGGLGIHLVRRLMDAVEYERKDGRNRLVCRKKIEA